MEQILATCPDDKYRDGRRALELANNFYQAAGDDAWDACEALAVGHAECGDFAQAVKWQTKALELTPADDKESRAEMQARSGAAGLSGPCLDNRRRTTHNGRNHEPEFARRSVEPP